MVVDERAAGDTPTGAISGRLAAVGLVLLGLLWGVAAAVGAGSGDAVLSDGATYAAVYVAVFAGVSALAPGPRSAAGRILGILPAFVVGYYGDEMAQRGALPGWYGLAWFLAAVLVCPPTAAAVRTARLHDRRPAAVMFGVLAAGALADGSLPRLLDVARGRLPADLAHPAQIGVDLAAAAIVLLLPASWRTRLRALLVFIPASIAVLALADAIHYGTGPFPPGASWW